MGRLSRSRQHLAATAWVRHAALSLALACTTGVAHAAPPTEAPAAPDDAQARPEPAEVEPVGVEPSADHSPEPSQPTRMEPAATPDDGPAPTRPDPTPVGPVEAPSPAVSAAAPRRSHNLPAGTGMLAAGAVLAGFGVLGRVGLEVFWARGAGLEPDEPFGRWSTPNIIALTGVNNVFVASGLGLLTAGAYRRGRRDGAREGDGDGLARRRKLRRDGIIVLTLGLTLYGTTRGIFFSVVNACQTNACVYGYLESTYWATMTMIHVGAAMTAYSGGFLREATGARPGRGDDEAHARGLRWSLAPMVSRESGGVSLVGAF